MKKCTSCEEQKIYKILYYRKNSLSNKSFILNRQWFFVDKTRDADHYQCIFSRLMNILGKAMEDV